MNQLTKLIEQYEKENPEKYPIFIDDYGNESFSPDFVALLVRLASRPTCGEEQRKFLDEIREKGAWVEYEYSDESEIFIAQEIQLGHSTICAEDFYLANLQELVNE